MMWGYMKKKQTATYYTYGFYSTDRIIMGPEQKNYDILQKYLKYPDTGRCSVHAI